MSQASNQKGILLESGTNEVEIFEFVVGTQSFGINVAKIQQIIRRDVLTVTRLDFAPKGVMGTILFRGKPTLAVDFHSVLGIPPAKDHSRQLMMVTEFNRTMTAFLVDSAVRIHRIGWDQFERFQSGFINQPPYVTGVVTVDGHLVLILDLEHIVAEINPSTSVSAAGEKIVQANIKKLPKILFADDSVMIRNVTTNHLKKAGFDKLTLAQDGRDAWEKIVALKARADKEGKPITEYLNVLLTDIEMPELDGLTLCKKVKQDLGLKIPVIVYSSLINEQMAEKCRAVGADAFMSKPAIDKIIKFIEDFDAKGMF